MGLNASQTLPNAQIPTPNYKTLSVTGKGSAEIPKTSVKVRLGIELKCKTSQMVQPEIDKWVNASL